MGPSDFVSGDVPFTDTHWSVVVLAAGADVPQAEAALEQLCHTYWFPLYAFVRRQGYTPHDAQDLTQEFFTRMIHHRKLRFADRERGRFRAFLLSSLKHFLTNEWIRGNAQKRGGGQKTFSLDESTAEGMYQQAAVAGTADSVYDKRWAVTLLERAMQRLAAAYQRAGNELLFNRLKPWLMDDASNQKTYSELASALAMNEGAVRVAVHRLRQRFRDAVREEVAQTVASPADIDEELRYLIGTFNS
jgi:RNA polymerase sigma factor (sigma-70 family)